MTSPWQSIAREAVAALRNMPCMCRRTGEWPIFANAAKASTCARCAVIARYEAHSATHAAGSGG